jgi:predicted RND superfamily exporter protein
VRPNPAGDPVSRLFHAVAADAVRRPWRAVALWALATAAGLALAGARLELATSNLDLVDPDLVPVAAFRAYAERFGTPNLLIVALAGEDERRLRATVDALAPRLERLAGVRSVLYRLPFDEATTALAGLDRYQATRDRRMSFLFVQPADSSSAASTLAPFVAGVRREVESALAAGGGIRASFTGLPQYALDDRDLIQRDLARLSILSLVLTALLFVVGFAEWLRPALAIVALLAATGLTLGVAALAPGRLTLVSAFFVSCLFGLGIDYGTYLVDRLEEELAEGRSTREALPISAGGLARGLLTGALATALALFTLLASGFRGFAELGWIEGVGVLLSLVAMVHLLPALLVLAPGRRRREARVEERPVGKLLVATQHPALAGALVLAAIAAPFFGLPRFDGDYLDLEPADSEAVRLERQMIARSDYSPQFAAFVTPDLAAAETLARRLRAEPTVAAVRSASDFELLARIGRSDPRELASWRANLEAPDGSCAVLAYPKGDIWDEKFAREFLARMRALDPRVTGMPVLGHFLIDLSSRALERSGTLAALVILALVWLDFRSLRWTLLAVTPTALGVALGAGVLRLLGVAFNPLNVLALPIVLGAAVDNGVHVVHRFRAEGGDVARTLAGAGRGVLFCAATTLAGFGTLIFTAHRGLAGFGLALTVGAGTSLVASLWVLPELLRLCAPRSPRRIEAPRAEEASA